jgi:uroporphyrinogen-III synthase
VVVLVVELESTAVPPLANRRILITRARGQASALATQLEALGATTILIPTIELAPPTSYCALDAALSSIRSFDWLIFTSANAVAAFVTRARTLNLSPHPKRIAAIGPATARAATEAGLTVDLIPPQAVAESLAEALRPHTSGASMLLVRAAVARDILPEYLTTAGATVTIAEAYRTIIPKDSVAELRTLFTTHPPDAITFTSASTAQNLAALLQAARLALPRATVLASIGPITSQAMRELGMEPALEAAEATIESLVAALRTMR